MGSMAVNGENGHKSLTDYAANKNNGVDCTSVAARGNYPVCDENYGYNVLRCSDEVRLTHTLPSPASRHRRRCLCGEIVRCKDRSTLDIVDCCLCPSGVESQGRPGSCFPSVS